jgi:DNA-binding CsgD family transcriptional regulator
MTAAIPADHFTHGDPKRYRRGCRCTACTRGMVSQNKRNILLRSTGRAIIRTPDRASAHVRALRAAGLTDLQITRASGVCNDIFYRVVRGDGRIHASTERKLLALPVPTNAACNGNHALIGATGTWRRLQALIAAGWPASELAKRLSLHPRSVNTLLHEPGNGYVQAKTAADVQQVYRELWGRRPEAAGIPSYIAERARSLAARRGWHPAAVWDDIDDPSETPQYGARASRVDAVVEDATELIAEGYSREAIADRLGLTWDAVRQAFIRKGTPLPELAA